MSSEQYDGMLGRILRDEGMALVEDNSGLWKEVAKGRIDDWFEAQPVNTCFVGEEIRLHLEKNGIEAPHHHNAWSAVIGGRVRSWLKSDEIEVYGLSAGKDPKAHARRMIMYRKLK